MKRLLVATDLLPKSEPAIDRAGILAREINADLSLLHARRLRSYLVRA